MIGNLLPSFQVNQDYSISNSKIKMQSSISKPNDKSNDNSECQTISCLDVKYDQSKAGKQYHCAIKLKKN